MDIQVNQRGSVTVPAAAHLGGNDCWALMRTVEVGRLAVVVDGEPEIFPVNYVVDHGTVVFRTANGTKLDAALGGALVAFESDGFDAVASEAWSVVVKGTAAEIHEIDELIAASLLPLAPWHGGRKHRFLRIEPGRISGRRFAVADGSIWHNPYSLRRSADFE